MPDQKNKEVITKNKVKCPHCGAELEVCEVFCAGELLGKPDTVVRDPLGRILITEWTEEPEYEESYICDYCGKPFKITASISIKTEAVNETEDFSNLSSSII